MPLHTILYYTLTITTSHHLPFLHKPISTRTTTTSFRLTSNPCSLTTPHLPPTRLSLPQHTTPALDAHPKKLDRTSFVRQAVRLASAAVPMVRLDWGRGGLCGVYVTIYWYLVYLRYRRWNRDNVLICFLGLLYRHLIRQGMR